MTAAAEKFKANIALTLVVLAIGLAIVGTLFCSNAFAAAASSDPDLTHAGNGDENEDKVMSDKGIGLIAAAVAFGLGAVGAGVAISHVGAAAMGAIAEKPQIAGQALIFVALAEGIVVFGFITALMILGKV